MDESEDTIRQEYLTTDKWLALMAAAATTTPDGMTVHAADGAAFQMVPEQFRLQELPREIKARPDATAEFDTVDSFLTYVEAFGDPKETAIMCAGPVPGRAKIGFTAILDAFTFMDAPDGDKYQPAGWRECTATCAILTTEDWQHWRGADKKPMSQRDFALFVERHLPNIHAPVGATLLEIVTSLSGSRKIQFDRGENLANGDAQFSWHEETTAGAGAAGKVDIPQVFNLKIAPFHGGPVMDVAARLRWRIADGALSLTFELVRPIDCEVLAFEEMRADVDTRLENWHVFDGLMS